MHAQILISGKSVSQQYVLYPLIFSSLHMVINGEWHEKHLYNQASHYGKYRMLNHQSVCPIINIKVGVSLNHGVSL